MGDGSSEPPLRQGGPVEGKAESRDRSTHRRAFLAGVGTVVTGLAGCSSETASSTATTGENDTDGGIEPDDIETLSPIPEDSALERETTTRELFRDVGTSLHAMDTLEGLTVTEGTASVDETASLVGSRSIAIEADGDSHATFELDVSGVDFTTREPSVAVRETTEDYYWATVALSDANGNDLRYSNVAHTADGWVRSNAGVYSVDDGFDRATVETLTVSVASTSTDVSANVDRLRTHPRPDRGRCVLTFDDATVSHYEKAFPMLEERGFRGCGTVPAYYPANDVQLDMLGKVAPENQDPLSLDQLREMQDAGWEFGAEMYTHSRTATLERDDIEAECYRAKRWLRDNELADELAFVTYPYGSHDEAVLDVASEYYALGRTVIGNLNRVSVTDPMHLAGHGVYSDSVAETKTLIDRADTHNQLLVLNFHGFDEYAWKEMQSEDVREVLDHLAVSDLRVQTYSELWEDLRDLHGVS